MDAPKNVGDGGGTIMMRGGAFLQKKRGRRGRRVVAKNHIIIISSSSSEPLVDKDNRLKKRALTPLHQQPATIVAHLQPMDPPAAAGGGEEFIGNGYSNGNGRGGGGYGQYREGQQRILPSFELQIRADEASSASLRIATAVPGEPQIVRCTIPADSRRAFIPSTLTLHRDGRKVGRMEEAGNSIIYEFSPWDDAIDTSRDASAMQTVNLLGGHQRIIRRRQEQQKKGGRHRKTGKKLPPKPILFHCSASVFPLEAQRRGRLPVANLYQRTLKMMPWHNGEGVMACAAKEAEGFCMNGGKCVKSEPEGIRYCLCANDFAGVNCERLGPGLLGAMPLSALCLSTGGLLLLLFLLVIFLGVLLARERRASRRIRGGSSKAMKAVAIRLDDKEGESADTPLEDLYDTADAIKERESPASAASLSSPSPSPSRIPRLYSTPRKKSSSMTGGGQQQQETPNNGYDNLEKLREEIQRQKSELEERRAASRQEGMRLSPPLINGLFGNGAGFELRRSPDMADEGDGVSLPSNQAPSPPKRNAAYINILPTK